MAASSKPVMTRAAMGGRSRCATASDMDRPAAQDAIGDSGTCVEAPASTVVAQRRFPREGLLPRMAWSARRFREHARDPVYGNGVALVLNSVVGSLLGFAFWMLAARRFAAADVGWGAAVVSAATLAALVGKAGFDAAVVRYAPSLEGEPLRRLVARALVASVLVTAAVSAVLLALAGRGVATLGPLFAPAPAALFLLLACGTAAMWILDALFIAEQVAVWTLARNVAFNLVELVGPIALAAAAGFAVPLAWALGLAASVAVALFVLPRILRRSEERRVGKDGSSG